MSARQWKLPRILLVGCLLDGLHQDVLSRGWIILREVEALQSLVVLVSPLSADRREYKYQTALALQPLDSDLRTL